MRCTFRSSYVQQSSECTPEMYAAQRLQRKADKKAWMLEKQKVKAKGRSQDATASDGATETADAEAEGHMAASE